MNLVEDSSDSGLDCTFFVLGFFLFSDIIAVSFSSKLGLLIYVIDADLC